MSVRVLSGVSRVCTRLRNVRSTGAIPSIPPICPPVDGRHFNNDLDLKEFPHQPILWHPNTSVYLLLLIRKSFVFCFLFKYLFVFFWFFAMKCISKSVSKCELSFTFCWQWIFLIFVYRLFHLKLKIQQKFFVYPWKVRALQLDLNITKYIFY